MPTVTEIERRFVVHEIDPAVWDAPCSFIRQGYLGQGLRVRIESTRDKIESTLTKKTGKGLSRQETTEEVSWTVADLLLNGTKYQVFKERYRRDGWEIDRYDHRLSGLIVAERELSSPDQPVVLPDWISKATEVTETVTNQQLAKMAFFLADSEAPNVLQKPPKRIVLTGAPCSGKSTALTLLKNMHPDLFCVPEAATILIGQVGILPVPSERSFQYALRRTQISFEDAAVRQAASIGKKAVILDRGTIDGAGFVGAQAFESLFRTTLKAEYDRYDAVIMLSLPDRETYDLFRTGNSARRETYETSKKVEGNLFNVWCHHPRFRLITAETWEGKYEAVVKAIEEELV